jgi:hypothetical protein
VKAPSIPTFKKVPDPLKGGFMYQCWQDGKLVDTLDQHRMDVLFALTQEIAMAVEVKRRTVYKGRKMPRWVRIEIPREWPTRH